MKPMEREEEVRKKVKILKSFYANLINFVFVNAVLIIIWLTFDRTGTFWPKYILVLWGLALIFKAYRMGVMPLMFHRSAFFNQEWEEKKVRELMRRRDRHPKTPIKKDEKEE